MAYSVLVGAGEWFAATDGAPTAGLFGLDTNSGEWQAVDNGLPADVEVRHLAVRRDNPQVIYAGTQDGPYRSDDGGDIWRALPLPNGTAAEDSVVWSICIDPNDPKTIYVGTQGTTVFRSRDSGESWHRLAIEEPEGAVCANFPMRVVRIAVAVGNPDDILVAFEIGGLVRSRDGCQSWESCNRNLLELSKQEHLRSAIVSDQEIEGMMDSHALVLGPDAPESIWLANRMGLFRSENLGRDWQEFGISRFSPLTYARDIQTSNHVPQRMYAALSVASVCDEGSLYRSDDAGTTWSRFDHGVDIDSTLMTIAEGISSPDRIYCAARHGKVYGTEDGGKTWQSHVLPGGVQGVYTIACL